MACRLMFSDNTDIVLLAYKMVQGCWCLMTVKGISQQQGARS